MTLDQSPMPLKLSLSDPEVCAEFSKHPDEPDRSEFAETVIKIGILAHRHAQGIIDVDRGPPRG